MLTATITGVISGLIQYDEFGRRYCSVISKEAKRSVRVLVRNDRHAEMIAPLPKGARVSVSGSLYTKGAISPTGAAIALLHIDARNVKIYEYGALVSSSDSNTGSQGEKA